MAEPHVQVYHSSIEIIMEH